MSALKAGDVVRVRNPHVFLAEFARKVTDRDAVVEWVGPDKHGQYIGKAKVKFLKRNGRGKEFTETLRLGDLIIAPAAKESA